MSDYNQNNELTEYTDFVFPYAYHCHEATLAFAYALNKTIAGKTFKCIANISTPENIIFYE